MKPLHHILLQLENHIPNLDKTNSKVSNSTVGWQIDHCLLVINGIVEQLEISNPNEFQPKWNFTKFMVFTTGKIPRGKAKAPKVVIPSEEITVDSLQESLKNTYQAIAYLKDCQEKQYFMHPFFGQLNKKQTIKFLAIHTEHHLKIIRDILK